MGPFSEPEKLKHSIDTYAEATLRTQEQKLRQDAGVVEVQTYLLHMSKVAEPGFKNLRRLGESLLKKNDLENAKKIITISGVYVAAAGREEFKDFNDSVRSLQLINLDAVYAYAKRIEPQVNDIEFKEGIADLRSNISRYGKNTQKFILDVLDRIEQLYERSRERAKVALNLLDQCYLANIIERNIIRGAGREEMEKAIQQCINGEDYSKAFNTSLAKNDLYFKSRKIYEVWKKFFDAAPTLLADDKIKKSFDSLDEKSKQGSIFGAVKISKELENQIKEKIGENLNAMSRVLEEYGKQLVHFRGYPSYEKMLNDFVELNKRLKGLASDDKIILSEFIEKSTTLTKSFNGLMARTNAYLYVAQMLEKERSYYLYLKDSDPRMANLMKDEHDRATSSLDKCLGYLAEGEFARASTQFSDAVRSKQNLLAATGLGAENYSRLQFYADAHQFLFSKLSEGIMLKEGENKAVAELQSRLFTLEGALRLSSEKLFVGGEEALGKRIFSNSRELILATLDKINGKEPRINIDKYEHLVYGDIERLGEKMELGQKRASYAEFFACFWPPAFAAIALKDVFHEQYVKGEVSGMSWAMLAFSVSWLKTFRLAVEGVGELGKAGKIFKTSMNTIQNVAGLGMIGLGGIHAYEQFKEGNSAAAWEILAQLAVVPAAYMAGGFIANRWKKYHKIGDTALDVRTYRMLRSAGLVEQRPKLMEKVSEKMLLIREGARKILAEENGSVAVVPRRAELKKLKKLAKAKIPKQAGPIPESPRVWQALSESTEFIKSQVLSVVGLRERIPLGDMEGFNDAARYLMSKGNHCFVAVLDKSLLNVFNNLGREVGDIAIDLYIASLKKALQAVAQKYPEIKILVQRTSLTSDEVTIAFLATDRRVINNVWKGIDAEFKNAERSVLKEARAMTHRGKNLGELIKNLKDEKEFVSSYAKKSEKFAPEMLTDDIIARLVANAENNSSLMYKDTVFNFFSRNTTYKALREKYGIGEELSFKSNMPIAQLNAPGIAFEIKLNLKALNTKLFNSLVNESVYKSLREIIENSFGVRGLNTFFGYGATNYITTLVDGTISNFVKKYNAAVAGTGKEIAVQAISPLKYIFTSGYNEAVARQLQDEIAKALMGKGVKISGVSMAVAEVPAAELASNALIANSLGLKLDPKQASTFVSYANRIVAILKGFKPEAAKKYIGHLPIYDDLVKVFSEGKNSKILRNVEDLVVHLRATGRGELVDKLVEVALKYGPTISVGS